MARGEPAGDERIQMVRGRAIAFGGALALAIGVWGLWLHENRRACAAEKRAAALRRAGGGAGARMGSRVGRLSPGRGSGGPRPRQQTGRESRRERGAS